MTCITDRRRRVLFLRAGAKRGEWWPEWEGKESVQCVRGEAVSGRFECERSGGPEREGRPGGAEGASPDRRSGMCLERPTTQCKRSERRFETRKSPCERITGAGALLLVAVLAAVLEQMVNLRMRFVGDLGED
jgi:hypothetical protein